MRSNRQPEILAPVNRLDEVAPLLAAGAAWLYGGCLPDSWKERYPAHVLLNQRTFSSAQFRALEELAEGVAAAHASGGRFALTLNAPFYMDSQMEAVLEMARFAQRSGIDALIVADPGLMGVLRQGGIRTPLHLSTMGMATNAAAVRMYRKFGVERVVLPRHLPVSDIADLVRGDPELVYEAFILVGKCPNVEGVCSFAHDSPDQRWPCEWAFSITGEDMEPPPSGVVLALDGVRLSDRRDSCGLCALPLLLRAGVTAFKVVGRGAPLGHKVRLVSALARSLTNPGEPGPEWISRNRKVYRSVFGHVCRPHNCYYPEVVPAEAAVAGRKKPSAPPSSPAVQPPPPSRRSSVLEENSRLEGWRVGSESCPHLVPVAADLDELAKGRDPERMTLVTSPLGPSTFQRCRESALAALAAGWREVVLNDWGLLASLAEEGCGRLTAGRLLMRFRRGPGYSDPWDHLEEESRSYFSWGPLHDTAFLDHLRGLGVSRLEGDPPRHWHPIPEIGNLKISLHADRRLVTVAGSCPWLFNPVRGSWERPSTCGAPCVARGTLMMHAGPLRAPLFLAGREVLEDAAGQWQEGDLPCFVDRIIINGDPKGGTETAWRTRNC